MRHSHSCRAFLAGIALTLGGCSGSPVGPGSFVQLDGMTIEGLPASQRIRMGESLLLSLRNVSHEVESIRWLSSNPRVLSVAATPAVSPCGSACAWVRGEAAGSARVEAVVCFVDGACQSVRRARLSTPAGPNEVEADVDVMF